MNDARRSAWTNPPAEDFDQAESTPEPQAAQPAAPAGEVCPDCGGVHPGPDDAYTSNDEADLYARAFLDEARALAHRYSPVRYITAVFAPCPAGTVFGCDGFSSATRKAELVLHLLEDPLVVDALEAIRDPSIKRVPLPTRPVQ